MKMCAMMLVAILAMFSSMAVFADETAKQPVTNANATAEAAKNAADAAKAVSKTANDLAQKAGATADAVAAGTPDFVDKMGEVTRGIGRGIADAAREAGIQVNEFARSPVGVITIIIIVWKFMGPQLSSMLFVLLWVGILLPLWVRQLKRTFGLYNEKGKFVKYDTEAYAKSDSLQILSVFYGIGLLLVAMVAVIKWP